MSPLEGVLAAVAGILSLGGALHWVRSHRHDEYVTRSELVQLELRLDAILVELRYLRDRLDRTAAGG